jgi:hypothetical protein
VQAYFRELCGKRGAEGLEAAWSTPAAARVPWKARLTLRLNEKLHIS